MIEAKNSYIRITDYEPNSSNVEKILSYWDDVYHSLTWNLYSYNENTKELRIPRGFSLNFLKKLLPSQSLVIDNSKDASMFTNFNLKFEPKDDEQKEAIEFLLNTNCNNRTQKMLCLKTGSGKTYCAINCIQQRKRKAIIILDTEAIIKQWYERFLDFTDLKEKDIYIISGSNSIDKIMKRKTDTPYQIFLASHRTLSSYAERNGWDSIDMLFKKLKVGTKVFDEAHVEFKNISKVDEHSNTELTIYLTATPGRSNQTEEKLYQRMFDQVPTYYGIRDRELNYHNIFMVNYNTHPSSIDQFNCKSKYGFDVNAYYKYLFENSSNYDKFISVIQQLLELTIQSKYKTAIIIHNISHVEKLKNTLNELYPNINVGLFYSKINKNDLPKELEKKIIISTDKSLGKAIDIPNLKYLISTLPISSTIVTEQILGRLRKLPKTKVFYFDLTDRGFSACISQQYKRKSLLNKKAESIKILNLD